MAVAAVAERAKLHIVTIERWLDIGVEYGLEALTAEQMRISFLTEEQRHEC
jgi:transposase